MMNVPMVNMPDPGVEEVYRPVDATEKGGKIVFNSPASEDDHEMSNADCVLVFKGDPDMPSDDSDDPIESSGILSSAIRNVRDVHSHIDSCITRHKSLLGYIFIAIVLLAAVAYFIAAIVIHHRQETPDLRPLVILAVAIVICLTVWLVRSKCGRPINRLKKRLGQIFSKKVIKVFNMVMCIVAFSGILTVIIITSVRSPSNLFSLLGFVSFVLLLWLLSEHPTKVNWRPVLAGFCLQFYLALLILRLKFVRSLFEWVGQYILKFLNFADAGSAFVFGQNFTEHFFAFKF